MTPLQRLQNLNDSQKIYNYRLSRARRLIESAFGVLVKKWGILRRKIGQKLETVDDIVLSLVCLHNFLKTGNSITTSRKKVC